jgi:uncharacterized protein involved in exopolysaccharide biosynthesis
MNLQQLWYLIKSRALLLILIVSLTFGVTYALSKVYIKPYYNASTTLLIDFKEPGLEYSILPAMLQEEYMTTQLGILKNMIVAEKAVEQLDYSERPYFINEYMQYNSGSGSINDWLAANLLDDIKVNVIKNSRLINISYTSSNPESAAEVPNAFANAYIETVLEHNLNPVEVNTKIIDERILDLRKRLQEAQRKLSAHQKEKNVLISEDRINIETLQLTTLTEKLAVAKANIEILQSKLDQVNSIRDADPSLQTLPEVISNKQVQSLKADLNVKRTQLAELSLKIGVKHPRYISTVKEINSIENNIQEEIRQIVSGMESELKAAINLAEYLEKAIDEQKSKVIDFKQDANNLPALTREVQSAQKSYEKALESAEDYSLLAQIKYTNVTVLNAAKIPDKPSGPDITKNLISSIVLGLFLGIVLIVLLEIRERKIRSKEDVLSTIGQIPLLGVLEEK